MSESDIYTCPTCEAINDVCGCPVPPPPERAILSDLIEELRGLSGDGGTLFLVDEALDRAEARLREVTDE